MTWRAADGEEQCDMCKRLLTEGEDLYLHRDYRKGPITYKCMPCVDKEEDEMCGRVDASDARYA